ncbi:MULTISPECIES: DUF3139 domain-containing protein [Bacillus]|nr:DUF3139 domain-containing protein [Bacillus pseudomycoides]MDF2086493.1 DUF3139 domain-containing protein [Bacillus pseudomycoides]
MYKSINGNTKRNAIINSGIYLLKCKIKYRRGAVNEKNIGITLIIIIVIIPIIFYFVLHGNPISKYLMVKDTKKYLIEKGYKEVDIMSIESKYDMKRNTDRIKGTVAYVVFKDEPKGEYLYIQWRDSGKIQQHCEYYSESAQAYEVTFTEKRKHMETICTEKY